MDSRANNGIFDVYVRLAREDGSGEDKHALGTIKSGESFELKMANNRGLVTVTALDKTVKLRVKDSAGSYLKFGNYLQAQDPVTRRKIEKSKWAEFYRNSNFTRSVITFSNVNYDRRLVANQNSHEQPTKDKR